MTMPSTAPVVGAEVYTADGHKLGTVKALRGSYFKIDASMHPDYWLSSNSILGLPTMERVTMAFDEDRLDDNKQEMKDD
jgi:hypothetical protein